MSDYDWTTLDRDGWWVYGGPPEWIRPTLDALRADGLAVIAAPPQEFEAVEPEYGTTWLTLVAAEGSRRVWMDVTRQFCERQEGAAGFIGDRLERLMEYDRDRSEPATSGPDQSHQHPQE